MPGIYDLPSGKRRAVAWIGAGSGNRLEKTFPKGTSDRKIARWQEQARLELRERPKVPKSGSLAGDLPVYEGAHLTMKSLKTRMRHLGEWVAILGPNRHRNTVTAVEVTTQLEKWESAGRTKPYSNRYRTALMSLYSELNGKDGYNPVRSVRRHSEPAKPPKRLSHGLFEDIIRAIPSWTGFGRRPDPKLRAKMIARLRVLAYLGLPHIIMKQLEPDHLDPAEMVVYVAGRDKGEGTEDAWLPIGQVGLAVLRAFFACGAQGDFRNETLRDVFKSGALVLGRPDLTPYDLRHLYGTSVLRSCKNRTATKDLMLHADALTTERYVKAAIPIELRAALAAFDADVVGAGCGQGVVLPPPSDANVPPVLH